MASPRPDKSTSLRKPDHNFGSRVSREAINDDESDIDDPIDEQRRADQAMRNQRDIALAELRIIEKFHATKVRSAVNEATLSRETQLVTRRNAGTQKDAKGESERISVALNYRFLPLRDKEGGAILDDEKALFELFMKAGAGRRKILTSMKAESAFARTTGVLSVSGVVLVPWNIDKLFIKVGPYPANEALAHLELDLSVVAALGSGEHVEFMAIQKDGGTVIDAKLLKNYDIISYGSALGKRILPFSFALNILAASEKFGLPLDLGRGFIVKASIMAADEDGEKYAVDVTTDRPVCIDGPSEESKQALGYPSMAQQSLTNNLPEPAVPRKHRSESLTREDPAKRLKSHQGSQQVGTGESNLVSISTELSAIHPTVNHNLSGALPSSWGGSLHHPAPLPLPPHTSSNYFNVRYDQTEAMASSGDENKSRRADDASKEEKEPLDIEPHFAEVTLDSRTMVNRYTSSSWTPSPDHVEKSYQGLKQRFSSKATHDFQNTSDSGPLKASGEADSVAGDTKPYQNAPEEGGHHP